MEWTLDALIREAIEVPRDAYAPYADIRVIRRPGWRQIITPSFKTGGLNDVTLAVLREDEVERVIDATLAEYAALGVKMRWTVGPDSRPLDLGARLAARGLRRSALVAMCRDTALPVATVPAAGAITIERIDAHTVGQFDALMARGWGVDPGPFAAYHAAALADAANPHRLFIARVAGEPAGAAGMILFPRSAYLIGGVVLPEHRSRGVYAALVAARLAEAAREGRTLATTHAIADTSAPRLARHRFDAVCRFESYAT